MRDEPLNDEPLNEDGLLQSEIDHLDKSIVRALEAAPQPQIPADFAARVARQLPATRPVSLTPTHYGKNAMVVGTLVTFVALVMLALHSSHATFGLLGSLLFAQFIALAVWLTVWRYGLR
ncbi:MAG: hypothetical protein JWQ49_2608 [Edaphobacter sp.]|nr:hypothetical protein [Edaphobacter sp.]